MLMIRHLRSQEKTRMNKRKIEAVVDYTLSGQIKKMDNAFKAFIKKNEYGSKTMLERGDFTIPDMFINIYVEAEHLINTKLA